MVIKTMICFKESMKGGAAATWAHPLVTSLEALSLNRELISSIRQVGRYLYLTWLACESLRDLFPAGAKDVLPSFRRSYPPQLPDCPHMALVDPGYHNSLFSLLS